MQMQSIVKRLERSLGPDTGDLRLRVGMNSGPVTGKNVFVACIGLSNAFPLSRQVVSYMSGWSTYLIHVLSRSTSWGKE